jgi:hypothetical protein
MLSKLRNTYFTSKILKLPVFLFIIRYIEARKHLTICYPTYFHVANLLQPSPCLNSYAFLYFHAYKAYLYRNPQQKCPNLNFGPLRFFFGWVLVHQI